MSAPLPPLQLSGTAISGSETGDTIAQNRAVFKPGLQLDTTQIAVIGGVVVAVGLVIYLLRK